MERQAVSLQELIETSKASFPRFEPEVQPIRVQAIRALAGGEPVPLAEIARAAGVSEQEVHRFFYGYLAPGWSRFDDAGCLIAFSGLTILPASSHQVTVDGRRLHAWCAWDTLFLPHLLQRPVGVRSVCPITREVVELRVTPERLAYAAPSTAVMSFVLADREQIANDVVGNFCHGVHFFASEEAGREWQGRHADSVLLTLEEGYVLGRETVGHGLGSGSGSPAGPGPAPSCCAV